MAGIADDEPYWSQDGVRLAAALGSSASGLTSAQAAELLRSHGPNSLEDAPKLNALRLLLRQFESPLVLILVFAAAISLGLQQWVDSGIILAIVLGSCLLSFLQEFRASQALSELKQRLALTCRVLRDGAERSITVREVVPGDVVLLSAGNLIPADGVVLEAQDCLVSQASMTGESFPVEKQAGVVDAAAPLAARTNTVFMGASVRSGTARMLVVKTGRHTEFGAIAATLAARPADTDFERGVRHFGGLLIRVMVVIVIFVLTVNWLLGRPAIGSLLFAVALAVGLSPELLPAIISVTLSAGARAMSRRGVIVRRLDAIENLGSMDILCTDKTGTLTQGDIVLSAATDARSEPSPEVQRLGFLNSAFETGIENPLDAAIVAAGKAAGLSSDGYTKVGEVPYDFVRRRLTVVLAGQNEPGQCLMVTKGAFSEVLSACTMVEMDGVSSTLDKNQRDALDRIMREKGEQGLRVLALATRALPAQGRYGRDDEHDLVFRGFLLFQDPPKPGVERTLAELKRLGIRTKVISGDNRYVTAHLAEVVGLERHAMLTGEQLSKLSDEALWRLAPRTDLFVEIDPQQKERIVRALQRTGHCVGFLGDGVNDAPALFAADVGISVDGAVDVARESADIILLQRDLDVLRTGIEDGRRTFANTLKYISITTSANFGNMVSMAIATPLLPFLPLAAKQILLNNFLSDVPSISISSDNVDPELVASPQRWNVADIRRFMIVFGLVSSCFDMVTFFVLLKVFKADEATFQTSWFLISVLTQLVVVLVLRTRRPAYRSRPSLLLFGATLSVMAVALAIPFLGAASALFAFVPLTATQLGAAAAIVTAYAVATDVAKGFFYRAAKNRRHTGGARRTH